MSHIPSTLTIATRQSPMALWQAQSIKKQLQDLHPNLNIELMPVVTRGDQELDKPLSDVGGKSLFVKALQQTLLEKKADIAVHCIKDMSVFAVDGLTLSCICKRDDPRDAFISNRHTSLDAMPSGSVIGTASPRRQSQLLSQFPHLKTQLLRGNVNTRLSKLDAGEYDAILLAAAGLQRLGFDDRITCFLDTQHFIPAIAQGALGIECRSEDSAIHSLLKPLHDHDTADCVTAERRVNQVLGGSCFTPIAAFATLHDNELHLQAMVGATDGSHIIHAHASADPQQAVLLGDQVAQQLIDRGAKPLLNMA